MSTLPFEPDLCWVEPGFALGSKPYAAQRRRIRELGIRSVISLVELTASERRAWTRLHVGVCCIPTPDWVAVPPSHVERVVTAVQGRLAAGEVVLLHCLAGVNRAPTFATAVLCARYSLAVDAALAQVRQARPSASPTPEQLASLLDWLTWRRSAIGP